MYTVYMVIAIVLVLSFITGSIVLIVEHKFKKTKLVVEKGKLVDEELL